jgi:hypothetical protein
MKGIRVRIEKFQTDVAECELIAKVATVPAKRETFNKLVVEYRKLARKLETVVINKAIPE